MVDDCLTRSAYKGLALQQRAEVMDLFKLLINNNNFKKIIEIGTGCGGLTMFLKDTVNADVDVYSFDILERDYHKALIENRVKLYYENIFKDVKDWNKFEIKEEKMSLFNNSPKLVLCDGGHKKGEFNCLADLLNPGDVIMLHDYSTDKNSFESLNVWNWLECQFSDIKKSCEDNNLAPYMHQEFLNVAWGCFIKL